MCTNLSLHDLVRQFDTQIGQSHLTHPELTIQIFRSVLYNVRGINAPSNTPHCEKPKTQKLTKAERREQAAFKQLHKNNTAYSALLQQYDITRKDTQPPQYHQCLVPHTQIPGPT
jgi:hypothetical protein